MSFIVVDRTFNNRKNLFIIVDAFFNIASNLLDRYKLFSFAICFGEFNYILDGLLRNNAVVGEAGGW